MDEPLRDDTRALLKEQREFYQRLNEILRVVQPIIEKAVEEQQADIDAHAARKPKR